jgi:uncharacterized protein (DUF1501 family)
MVGPAQACAFATLRTQLHEHLGVSEGVLAETVFPDSAGVKAAQGLVG